MATSLAQQLQKLAAPQTSLLQRDKKRASLLFEPKVAAEIDRDTFYDIGVSGLRELQKYNEDFRIFEQTLFSGTSRNIERAVESKESNIKLNKHIKNFLMLLSPYLLLKPAHKALEWLIHRFSIHEYNKNEFLKLILPYHETNIFARCLQLLNVQNPSDRWHWLLPVQQAGIHLPKATLYNHATSVEFLKFLNEMVQNAIAANKLKSISLTTLFSFYCTTTIGCLEHSSVVTEPQVSTILQSLLVGLSSKIPDYTASAYMVTAQLLKNTKLSQLVLNRIVEKITDSAQHNLRAEATLLLLLVYQSQRENYTTMPETAAASLAQCNWFTENVVKLADGGSYVVPLLVPVFKVALKMVEDDLYKNFVEKLLMDVRLDNAVADILIKVVLDGYPILNEVQYSEESTQSLTEWYGKLLKRLETQYPSAFDAIVRETMSKKLSHKHRQALQHIMNFIMSVGTNIFEKLYHPNAECRCSAVQYLVRNYNTLSPSDMEMLEGAIAERFLDDDKRVVIAVLQLRKQQLIKLLGEETFLNLSIKLLTKCLKNDKWIKVAQSLIKILCFGKVKKDTKLFLAILPFVFPKTTLEVELAMEICKSEIGKKFVSFTHARKKLKSNTNAKKFCDLMYEILVEQSCTENLTDLYKCLEVMEEMRPVQKYFTSVLIAASLLQDCSAESAIVALQSIKVYLNEAVPIKDKSVFACVEAARKGKIPLEGMLKCLQIILSKTVNPAIYNRWLNLVDCDESTRFFIDLLTILLNGCNSNNAHVVNCYSLLFKESLNKLCTTLEHKINFLCNFLTLDNFPLKEQIRMLNILNSLIANTKLSVKWIHNLDSKFVIPGCLIGLINPAQEVRIASLRVLEQVSINNGGYAPLVLELLKRKEEMLLDNEQLPLILFTIYEENNRKLKQIVKVLIDNASDVSVPIHVTSKLLRVLTFINSNDIFDQTAELGLRILESGKNLENVLDVHSSAAFHNIVLRFDELIAKDVKLKSLSWEMISFGLKHHVDLQLENQKLTCSTVLILEQLTQKLFANLSFEVQSALVKLIVEITTVCENPEVILSVNKLVKRIDLDAKLLIDDFTAMKDVKSNKVGIPQRKFRRNLIPTSDILDMLEWKRGITVLEFIQDKKKLSGVEMLLPFFFDILKKCLDFDEQAPVEYPKQLLLSTILHCCSKMEADGQQLPTTAFNMELVVQCVRASQNPQTHHHALLVLAHTARLIPDQVLHNIMAIFTFMGSSVLRYDDAYSFQIISKIIDTVVPILATDDDKVASVLRVFVDVVLDVPEHRRMPLFTKLLMTLGVEKYLWVFLILMFEAHVAHGADTKNSEHLPKRLDIATNITLEFTPEVIISTAIRLLEYIKSLPVDKEDNLKQTMFVTFNLAQYTSKQFRHYKYIIITFLSGLLSSKQLMTTFASLSHEDVLGFEPLFKNQIISILTYTQAVSKTVDRMSKTPQAQYWKVMLHHSCDVLDSINALLPSDMFLLVIRGLLVHNILIVRRKAMELLNTKLQYQPSFFYTNASDMEITNTDNLFALLPLLIEMIKSVVENVEPEEELTQQTALLSLKLLVKLLAGDNPEKFVPILDYITDLIKSNKVHGNILASVILCLAELCSKLRAHAIPGLVRFMPAVIKALKHQIKEAPGLLLMCIITAIQKIVDSLPLFLSPYLEKLLCELSILHVQMQHNDFQSSASFIKKLEAIANNIGGAIPARVLIPIVSQTYKNLLSKHQYEAVGPLMSVLANNLSKLQGPELTSLLQELTGFFLDALQFRVENESVSDSDVMKVEDHLIKTLLILVLKLSETTFRPFYYRLFDWAVRNEVKSEKIITFYRLSAEIAESLKSLFVLFAGHFVKNAASILDYTNSVKSEQLYFDNDEKNLLLIESILKTLRAIFLYDSQNFINKERFELLMQPIVDQLENTIGGFNRLRTTANELLIPCITQFAVATADDALWKQLNYHILLKTRHNQPAVRLIALECVSEFAKKLNDDFLPLLPETIPFLAELLEDEDETVESACQKVVQDLEKVLGEPLQKYF